jgi:hypothetical protein
MAKFIYLYRGPATPMSDLTPEQGAERMAAFGAWMEKAGAALVDVGSPFGPSASVRDDGAEGTAGDLTGYSIVEADDLAGGEGTHRRPAVPLRQRREVRGGDLRAAADVAVPSGP